MPWLVANNMSQVIRCFIPTGAERLDLRAEPHRTFSRLGSNSTLKVATRK